MATYINNQNHNNGGLLPPNKGYWNNVLFGILIISILNIMYVTTILNNTITVVSPPVIQDDSPAGGGSFYTSADTSDTSLDDDDNNNNNNNDNYNDDDTITINGKPVMTKIKTNTNTKTNTIKSKEKIINKQTATKTKAKTKTKAIPMQQQNQKPKPKQQNQQQPLFISTGEYFEPGSLIHQSRAKTLSQCYVGTKEKPYINRNSIKNQQQLCTHTPDYKLTIRHGLRTYALEQHFMEDKFNISKTSKSEYFSQPCHKFKNNKLNNNDNDNSLLITVLDHPIQRFMAGIRLMFNQRGVFAGGTKNSKNNNNNQIPKKLNRFLKIIEHMNENEKVAVSLGKTPNDLMLKIQMYDTFIQDYYFNNDHDNNDNNELLHDTMIPSRIPSLFNSDESIYDIEHFDEILDATTMSIDIEKLFNNKKSLSNATHLTKGISFEFDYMTLPLAYAGFKDSIRIESLSNTTIQQLCRMFITELCCMNYKLPTACQSSTIPTNERVQCEWVQTTNNNNNNNNNNERRIIGKIGSSAAPSASSALSISDRSKNTNLPSVINPNNNNNNNVMAVDTIKHVPFTRTGIIFEPGTIQNQSRAEIVSQCYVGNNEFPYIKPVYRLGCAYSTKYKLLLWLIEKTGSNTQMNVMRNVFLGKAAYINRRNCVGLDSTIDRNVKDKLRVAVTRHPVDQFISGVKEVFDQLGIFTGTGRKYTPKKYQNFMSYIDNMSLEEKRNVSMGITPKDLNITTSMFEQFVNDYDGEYVFNTHIGPMIPKLFKMDIYTLDHRLEKFDYIMDSSTLIPELTELAKTLKTKNLPKHHKARSAASFGTKALGTISNTTIQKICKLVITDLCCLNYKLPDVCRDNIPSNERIMCEWIQTSKGEKRIIGRLGDTITS